jgi:hypothetical protein
MTQQNPQTPYAAFNLAGQAGCIMVGIALLALVVGLGLDGLLHTPKHILTLVLVVVSAPVSLGLAVLYTQRMMKRIIPPTTGGKHSADSDSDNDETNRA